VSRCASVRPTFASFDVSRKTQKSIAKKRAAGEASVEIPSLKRAKGRFLAGDFCVY
jgi:hypothetical protein